MRSQSTDRAGAVERRERWAYEQARALDAAYTSGVRVLRALPEILMWILIVAMAIVNLAVYTHVVRGEDAINLNDTPPAGSPRLLTTPVAGAAPVNPANAAELDDSDDLPGRFVPTQGRQHTATAYPLARGIPFCDADAISARCYASNPPSSGTHLPVQRNVLLADGNRVNIPPDPGVYDFAIPREAIPHIEEHAGVYVGYHCVDDAGCDRVAERLKDLVTQEVSLGARVVLSPDPDLDANTVGIASWTRVDTFDAAAYEDGRVRDFIKAHSCRFDPEGFCKQVPVN